MVSHNRNRGGRRHNVGPDADQDGGGGDPRAAKSEGERVRGGGQETGRDDEWVGEGLAGQKRMWCSVGQRGGPALPKGDVECEQSDRAESCTGIWWKEGWNEGCAGVQVLAIVTLVCNGSMRVVTHSRHRRADHTAVVL